MYLEKNRENHFVNGSPTVSARNRHLKEFLVAACSYKSCAKLRGQSEDYQLTDQIPPRNCTQPDLPASEDRQVSPPIPTNPIAGSWDEQGAPGTGVPRSPGHIASAIRSRSCQPVPWNSALLRNRMRVLSIGPTHSRRAGMIFRRHTGCFTNGSAE